MTKHHKRREEIGIILREYREGHNLTTYKAAKLSGCFIHTIEDIERGDKNYRLDSLLKLLQAYDIELTL